MFYSFSKFLRSTNIKHLKTKVVFHSFVSDAAQIRRFSKVVSRLSFNWLVASSFGGGEGEALYKMKYVLHKTWTFWIGMPKWFLCVCVCVPKLPFGKWHCSKFSASKAKRLLTFPRRRFGDFFLCYFNHFLSLYIFKEHKCFYKLTIHLICAEE